MKQKHVAFNKIGQFRDTIRNIKHQTYFTGLDVSGEPIYDESKELPIITFSGTVKLHGSNGSICFSDEAELWYQSRNRILTIGKDNNGFWQFCHNREKSWKVLLNQVVDQVTDENKPIGIVSIFGEYCGQGINSGCAIHKLPKMFVIFAVKIVPTEGDSYYIVSNNLRDPSNQIYNISDFKTFMVDVDFNHPEIAQNKFTELVDEVERECPVGKIFGVSGIGEGIVWTAEYNNEKHSFKTKGQLHSATKVKTIASVDIEKINNVNEFVRYAVTENRLDQAISEVFEGKEPTIKQMGDFLKWIVKDIGEEEADTLKENNLILKDTTRAISNKARPWFQNLLNKNAGL